MASYDSDDTDESVVRAFEDAIRLGIETGGPEDDRLQYYASSRSTSDQCRQDPNHEGQEKGDFDFPAHRRPHDAGLGVVESFEEFGSTDFPAARRLETVRRVRYMKYEQQWNEPSHVGGSVSKNTRLEEKEISERQAVQLLQDPHVLPQPQTIGHGAVNTRDTQHHGKTDFHLHLTQHVTNIINPTAVTVGGKVTVRPDLEEYEPKHDIVPSETQILRSETENRIQEWIEGMVPTEASRIIAEMLLHGRTWVTVIGGPGEGKTTAAYMALKSLHNNGREVYDVHSPEDYFKLKGSKGPVLMLNDIFGSSHFDLSNLTKWTTVLNDILSMKEHRGVRNIRKNKGVVPFSVRGERNLKGRSHYATSCCNKLHATNRMNGMCMHLAVHTAASCIRLLISRDFFNVTLPSNRCDYVIMASFYDTDSDDDLLEVAMIALLTDVEHETPDRTCWVRPWIARRSQLGAYNALMNELDTEDPKTLSNFLRMDKESFTTLVDRVSPLITRADTPMREAIPAGEKLAITLRYLATGDSYKSLEYLYRVPKNTISGFIPDVCQAIYDSLKDDYLKTSQLLNQ